MNQPPPSPDFVLCSAATAYTADTAEAVDGIGWMVSHLVSNATDALVAEHFSEMAIRTVQFPVPRGPDGALEFERERV